MTNENPMNGFIDDDVAGAMDSAQPEHEEALSRLPDGQYVTKVVETTFGPSQRSGALMFTTQFEVLGPESVTVDGKSTKTAGRRCWKHVVLKTKEGEVKHDNISRLLGDLQALGLNLAGQKGVAALLAKKKDTIVGVVAVLTLKTNKRSDWQNIFVDRRAEANEVAALSVAAATSHGSATVAPTGDGSEGFSGGGGGSSDDDTPF